MGNKKVIRHALRIREGFEPAPLDCKPNNLTNWTRIPLCFHNKREGEDRERETDRERERERERERKGDKMGGLVQRGIPSLFFRLTSTSELLSGFSKSKAETFVSATADL